MLITSSLSWLNLLYFSPPQRWQDIKKDEMELQRENLINDLDKVQRRLAGVQLRHSVELGSLITEEMKEDVKVQDSEAVNRDEGPHRDGVEIVGMELD